MKKIERKSLLYRSDVEYGDFTINHVQGCAHGCKFPCYAMQMAKRFGKIKTYDEWREPAIVSNAIELLEKEIPKYKKRMNFVHLCFMTDPFMMGYPEVSDLTLKIIHVLNENNIKITLLTKGVLPKQLANTHRFNKFNEYGISLVSICDSFHREFEPYTSTYKERVESLYHLHEKGLNTWVSIEPYPTPNIIDQDIRKILNEISFVNKIVFGRMNYNKSVSQFKAFQEFYNKTAETVADFCTVNNIDFHIKDKTVKKEEKVKLLEKKKSRELFRRVTF